VGKKLRSRYEIKRLEKKKKKRRRIRNIITYS
jgi:hypothetical protein